jgi:hypothetical protein
MQMLMRQRRSISELQQLQLLHNATFFEQHVPRSFEDRRLWLVEALHSARDAKIVALKPDNGMALRCLRSQQRFEHLVSHRHYRLKANPRKYVFSDEIMHFYRQPYVEICIVYQHLSRCFSHDDQVLRLLRDLQTTYRHVVAIKHKPYSPRAFFFLCKSAVIKESLESRLQHFHSRFGTFWELFMI